MTDNKNHTDTMNRSYRHLFLIGFALAAALACTNKDDYLQPSVQQATGDYPSVFSVDEYSFDSQGSTGIFSYVAEGSWRVSQSPEWLFVSPNQGREGRTLVTISTQLNQDWADRSGTLVFTGGDGQTHSISVTQESPKLGLSVKSVAPGMEERLVHTPARSTPEGKFELPFLWSHAAGRTQPVELTVSSNLFWEMVLDDDSFFTLSTDTEEGLTAVRGAGGSKVYINAVKNNYSKEDVSGLVTLKAYTDDSYSQELSSSAVGNWTLDLSQTHLLFLLGLSSDEQEMLPDDLEVSFDELGYAEGSSREQRPISVKCELPWSVTFGTYSRLDDASDGVADEVVTRQLEVFHQATQSHVNPLLEEQVDTMYFRAIDQSGGVAVRKLAVHQKKFIFSASLKELKLDNGVFLEDGTRTYSPGSGSALKKYEMSLTTTGAWRLESLPDAAAQWLEIDPATRSGAAVREQGQAERTVRFWVKQQNLSLEDAVALLKFRPDYPWAEKQTQLHADVSVSQGAFQFDARLENPELSATQLFSQGVTHPLQITSSGPWKLYAREGNTYRPVSTSDWIQLDRESGNQSASAAPESEVQLGARAINPGNQSRSTKLYLLSDLHEALPASARQGYAPREISISQRRFTFRVNGSETGSTLQVPAYMKNFDSALQIESDGNWRINSWPEWLSPEQIEASLSQGNVNRNVLLNPNVYADMNASRSGKVSVTCSYPGRSDITLEVNVVQSPLVFKVTGAASQEFHPVSNFEYEGRVLNESSWNYSVEATNDLPWTIVSGNWDMSFIDVDKFVSTFSGEGSLASGKLYPYINSLQDTRRFNFYFETTDPRFGTPVRVGDFRLSQRPFEWGTQAVANMEFDALSTIRQGRAEVSFKCSGPWWIENLPAWATVNGADYMSDPSFTVSVSSNTDLSPRARTLTVRSAIGNYSKSFTLSQMQYFFDTNPTQTLEFSTIGATDREVTFQCSGPWAVSSTANLQFDQTSGSGNPTGQTLRLRFHPSDYFEESSDRSAYFDIRSTMEGTTGYQKRVFYRQPAYVFNLSASSLSLSGPKDVSERSVTVQVSAGETWTAGISNQDVATIATSSSAIRIVPKANYTQSSRSATITVSTEVGKKSKSITLSQPEYRFGTSPASLSFDSNGGEKSLTVTCDGNWTLDVPAAASWLTVTPTSGGSGSVTVKVTAATNKASGASDRSATLTLKGSDNSSLSKTITVTQTK